MQKLRTVGTVHGLGFQRAAGVILKNKFQGSFYHLFEKLVAARAPLQNGRGQNQQPQPQNRSACADAWLEKPTYRYLRDALTNVEHVGLETQPNLEKVAWLNPDAIIASHFRHERVAPLLSAMATSVYAKHRL